MRSSLVLAIAALALIPARVSAEEKPASGDTFVPAVLPLPTVAPPAPSKKKGPDSAPVEELHPSPESSEGYRVVEAYGERERQAELTTSAGETSEGTEPKRLRLAPRIGALIPRTELSTGLIVGAEGSYLLPLLSDQLRASIGAGYSFTGFKGPRLDPGRGFDPAAIQNSTVVPLELLVSWSPLDPAGPFELAVGAGYGLYVIHSEVSSLGSSASASTAGSALLLSLCGGYRVGPGVLLAEVRHAEVAASFEALPSTAQQTFSGTALTVGFGLEL